MYKFSYVFIKYNTYLVKKKTVSIFFLIPPVSAIMAYLFLGENLDKFDMFGLLLTTIGVYIATRKNIRDCYLYIEVTRKKIVIVTAY